MKHFYYRLSGVVLVLFLVPLHLIAQMAPVTITVNDGNGSPVPFASVTVTGRPDSSFTRSALADTNARVVFELDTPGLYTLKATALNYKPVVKHISILKQEQAFGLVMEPAGNALQEVTIREVKALIRQEDDKTIIDPQALADASTSGYEVLEKTPGIFVDQDGNIYLSSTTPATVYINGREMKMSRNDIATMLKSLPPNAIERIEVLRTPSAKYDAGSSGGIVNVVLKKGVRIGLTGSANAGFQQGQYGTQFAGGSLSDNNGSTSSYLNFNYSRHNNYEVLNTRRLVGTDSLLSQEARTVYPGNSYFTGYGINHDWTDRLNLGYDGQLSYDDTRSATRNDNTFSLAPDDQVLAASMARLENDNRTFTLNQNLSSVYKLDTAGSEWRNDFTYVYSSAHTDQVFSTESAIPYGGDGAVRGNRHYLTLQTDVTYKFPRHISLEGGAKASYMSFRNGTDYFLSYNGARVPDDTRTSAYRYSEQINAAYLQASKGIHDIILKAGLRLENTNMDGRQQVPGDTAFRIRRTDFFPYVYLSKRVMTIAGFELRAYLVYRRTISRPSYDQLNPFPRYVDQFLSEAGNPALKPQFTNNYEINVCAAEHPVLALGYNDTKDMFSNVYYQSGDNKAMAYRTYDNVGRNREIYFRGLGAIPPGGRYFFVLGGQYNYNIYEGLYEGKPLSFRQGGFLFFTYHQLKLDRNSQLTLSGFLRLKGPLQFYELSSIGALNISVNRKFFKQKLTVTLSGNDILFTRNNTFTINQGSVSAAGYRESDSRRFGLSLRYHFGLRRKEEDKNIFNMQPDKVSP